MRVYKAKYIATFAFSLFSVVGLASCDRTEGAGSSYEKNDSVVDQSKTMMSDTWITTKVKSELLADDQTKGLDVKVITKEGVVSLQGKLQSQDSIDHVRALAADVEGVKRVDTAGLTVAPVNR